MKPSERLKEIELLYCEIQPDWLREVPHNADVIWLINRVKQLTEALELLICSEPTNEDGEFDLITQNSFWKARKALEGEK